jgi:hypothetical protein
MTRVDQQMALVDALETQIAASVASLLSSLAAELTDHPPQ